MFWGRVILAILFCFTGFLHFFKTKEMLLFLPPWVPFPIEIIYVTGILELAASIGILLPRFRRVTGICLMTFLVCIFPANIYGAYQRIDLAGHGMGPVYLWVRAPLQILLIFLVYLASVK